MEADRPLGQPRGHVAPQSPCPSAHRVPNSQAPAKSKHQGNGLDSRENSWPRETARTHVVGGQHTQKALCRTVRGVWPPGLAHAATGSPIARKQGHLGHCPPGRAAAAPQLGHAGVGGCGGKRRPSRAATLRHRPGRLPMAAAAGMAPQLLGAGGARVAQGCRMTAPLGQDQSGVGRIGGDPQNGPAWSNFIVAEAVISRPNNQGGPFGR